MATMGKRIPPEDSISELTGRPVTEATASATPPSKERNGQENQEGLRLTEAFEARQPKFTFDDIVLPEVTTRQIEVLKSRIRNHHLLYDEWGLKAIDPRGLSVAVNFYGQPGTGKTMCAEALAAHLGMPLIEVNYAEIESKYVGETPKNIRAAFKKARESGAVLFFDEADSILGRRMTNVTQAADHGVNVSRAVMLKQLDESTGIVLFATNLAKNCDGAFVRRILQHIEVPPPDEKGRLRLWQKMVSSKVPGRDLLPFQELARLSDGLVGGEIRNAVIMCLSEVANRDGADRIIRLDDVTRAIESVRHAKRDIGRYDYHIEE
ncbi:MAG: ATP-binding protein [Planctomycetota bacterium]|nr:ATP-binding protein [Planctomycetota bacterium]